MTYQAHDESNNAVSDTQHKLRRLRLPEDLTGKRVLDIGCNEGFFCGLALQRGAASVIGIDFDASNIEFAKAKYGDERIQFLRQSWAELPPGLFDLVIWSSAMHYELDARSVAEAIFDRLAPGGLFVLECGVLFTPGKDLVPVPRIADTRWYPTREFLFQSILARFSARQVAEAEIAFGDYVPRVVIHCTKALPSVILVRGSTLDGKSTVAERLRVAATKVVSLDSVVSRMGVNKHPHDELERFFVESYDPQDLGKLYMGIDAAKLTEQYVDFISKAVSRTDEVVIIEGYITDAQFKALTEKLRGSAVVWDMHRAQ